MKNLTPHTVILQNPATGETKEYPSSGVARVAVSQEIMGEHGGLKVVRTTYGNVEGMPSIEEAKAAGGVIVSSIVLSRLGEEWTGVAFAPDTSPNGGAIRNEAGQIQAVTQLVTV